MKSINAKLMLEPYEKTGVKTTGASSGFVTVSQKSTIIGLKAVADGVIAQPQTDVLIEVKKGDMVMFPEDTLHNAKWSSKTYTAEGIEQPFILAEAVYAVAVHSA